MDMKSPGKEKEEDQGQGGWILLVGLEKRWQMTKDDGEESSMTFTANQDGGTSRRKRSEDRHYYMVKIFALQLVTHLSITIANIMS